MVGGWVKLHRKMVDWEWFSDVNVAHFFIYCLLMANSEDATWRCQLISRGSFISSLARMSVESGLSVQEVRTCISKLKRSGEITSIATNESTTITITNYDRYQLLIDDSNKRSNKQPTNEETSKSTNVPTSGATTNKNIRSKEDNNINTLSPARGCTCEGGEDEFDRYAAFLETWVAKFKESHGGQEPSLDMLTKNRATSITYNIERAMKNDGVEINEEKFRLYLAQWLGRGWESVDDFARGQWSLAYIEKNFDYINSSVHGNKERAAVAGATHGKCNGQTIQIKRASGGYESDI